MALDHLQAVDLALDLAGGSRSLHGGGYRQEVFFQFVGEPNHRSVLEIPSVLDPQS
jgi:hypothetical protein